MYSPLHVLGLLRAHTYDEVADPVPSQPSPGLPSSSRVLLCAAFNAIPRGLERVQVPCCGNKSISTSQGGLGHTTGLDISKLTCPRSLRLNLKAAHHEACPYSAGDELILPSFTALRSIWKSRSNPQDAASVDVWESWVGQSPLTALKKLQMNRHAIEELPDDSNLPAQMHIAIQDLISVVQWDRLSGILADGDREKVTGGGELGGTGAGSTSAEAGVIPSVSVLLAVSLGWTVADGDSSNGLKKKLTLPFTCRCCGATWKRFPGVEKCWQGHRWFCPFYLPDAAPPVECVSACFKAVTNALHHAVQLSAVRLALPVPAALRSINTTLSQLDEPATRVEGEPAAGGAAGTQRTVFDYLAPDSSNRREENEDDDAKKKSIQEQRFKKFIAARSQLSGALDLERLAKEHGANRLLGGRKTSRAISPPPLGEVLVEALKLQREAQQGAGHSSSQPQAAAESMINDMRHSFNAQGRFVRQRLERTMPTSTLTQPSVAVKPVPPPTVVQAAGAKQPPHPGSFASTTPFVAGNPPLNTTQPQVFIKQAPPPAMVRPATAVGVIAEQDPTGNANASPFRAGFPSNPVPNQTPPPQAQNFGGGRNQPPQGAQHPKGPHGKGAKQPTGPQNQHGQQPSRQFNNQNQNQNQNSNNNNNAGGGNPNNNRRRR